MLKFRLLRGVLSLCAPGSHSYPRGCCCRAVRQAYLQNGGNDPDILAQLAQMQAEAQAIDDSMRNAQKRQPKGRLLDRKCIACCSAVAYQCYCGLSVWDWVIGKWGWERAFVRVCGFQREDEILWCVTFVIGSSHGVLLLSGHFRDSVCILEMCTLEKENVLETWTSTSKQAHCICPNVMAVCVLT